MAPDSASGRDFGRSVTWIALALAATFVGAVGSVVGLAASDRIYGRETEVLADTAIAQDLVNLGVVVPLAVVLVVAAVRGSVRGALCLPGCMAFTAYNYAIYAFSIHFGPLFLVWVAVLGLSVGSLVTTPTWMSARASKDWFGRALPLPAWTLIGLGTVFVLLWLSQIVPDLLAGRPSTSAAEWRVPTNPVHVLDLGLFLPAVLVSGALLLRGRPMGFATAPGALVFIALTCLPILMTLPVAAARGHQVAAGVAVPIGLALAVTVAALWSMLRHVQAPVRSLQETR